MRANRQKVAAQHCCLKAVAVVGLKLEAEQKRKKAVLQPQAQN